MYTPFELAENYVNNTGISIFLTGKAGTGKTTFLQHIRKTTNKRCVVVAPTGVAAINANGVTIHSFFQLPFSPYLPDLENFVSEYSLSHDKRRLRKEKLEIIRTLDLLIIDEISMVRADLLDAIDDTLRRYRHSAAPFGGVQLLMIGDLHQLPPVVKDDEWNLMKLVYASPFFFNSERWSRLQFLPHFSGGVAQLVRVPPCHGGCCGFKSRLSRHFYFKWQGSGEKSLHKNQRANSQASLAVCSFDFSAGCLLR